ncbi:glycerol-3-phosphate dehydrogenase [Histoplasma capsulatum H143]|uniref:Glycerol-3-phosphate dehydrogenase n=1 Tax=Ajellomyces capsulatus (strain H143) TaxID=544712 RepID=C6HQ79_AJECH|nr:glycerol-3-phosphate dehydrogenase [Histoplasma capsulatum H143]
MTNRPSSRFLKPFFYKIAAAVTGGGGILYLAYRPRNIPGSDPAPIPVPSYSSGGNLVLPRFPRVKTREEQIQDLKRSSQAKTTSLLSGSRSPGKDAFGPESTTARDADVAYDLLVIGGGATGSGIALDAASRGLKVALVERDDFSAGTSSKSTKLVHGGVRYLEKAVWELDYNQFALVKEALRERKWFLYTAPHLSMWLPIMVPVQKWWQLPYFWAGTKFYDFLAASEGIESSYFLTKSKALDAFPMLKKDNLFGALVYYDGAHNDSRMNVSLALTAALYGSTVVNHMEVVGLTKDESGRLNGARLKDLIPGKNGKKAEEITIRARGIINATGPFTDSIRKMDDQSASEIVAPSAGVHVVLPGYYSPTKMGLIDPATSDGRVIFFLPWQGNTIAGTTDVPTTITAQPIPSERDINWILNEIRGYLAPGINVRRGDVLAAWAGIRPLVRDPIAKNTESLVRSHLITVSESGLLTCAGGKWTTYRQMAEDAVDEAIKQYNLQPRPNRRVLDISGMGLFDDGAVLDGSCQTHQIRLVGAHGYSKTLFIRLIQHFGIATDVAQHLAESYGDRAWDVAAMSAPTKTRFPVRGLRISPLYPFIDGEVRYGTRVEYAQTAVDILARRTRLAFLNAQAALEALPTIIDIMAEELNWDVRRKNVEWNDTVTFLLSMGLPISRLGVTREDVESGQAKFDEVERKLYTRHEGPVDFSQVDANTAQTAEKGFGSPSRK